MKIGLITDAHLFHKNAITPGHYKNILIDKFKDVDIIVDCGDMVDKPFLIADQLDWLQYIFKDLDKPFYYVAGNHDSLNSKSTALSILKLKSNIKVITEPTKIENLLFIPYTDDIKSLYNKLDELNISGDTIIFSHLNITNNMYAIISIKNCSKLLSYGSVIINGHIHTPETFSDIYGTIYNIGSCSSLTFGDEHIPCYSILDIDENNEVSLENYTLSSSLIHLTYIIKDSNDADTMFKEISQLSNDVNLRVKLYNNSNSLELRKYIREQQEITSNIRNIQFDYIKEEIKKTRDKTIKHKSINIIEQLFQCFEKDNNTSILDNIKKDLL